MPDYYVFRPRSNWVYIAIVVLIGGSATISFFIAGFNQEGWMSLANTLAVCALLWVFVTGPKVVYTKEGIEIHNPFNTVKVGWLSTVEFVTRYAFTVQTETKNFAAWAAPAPGRFNARKIHQNDFRGTGLESRVVISPSDSPRAESGVALILALKHREHAQAKGTASEHLIKSTNWLSIGLLVGSAIVLLYNFVH
jgi:hypothetical protein